MARIRSIHPGLFTDDGFMALSMPARLLWIGLWTEADDQGVFEWKPLSLKARLFPVDNVDVAALLDELAVAGFVARYYWPLPRVEETRQYACIRNFRKFQRPKFPNAIHPIPDEYRSFVGLTSPPTEMAPVEQAPFPRNAEKSPQMEDGEKEGEERKKEAPAARVREELAKVLDSERVEAVIEHRKAKRAKLTPHAAKLLAGKFSKCQNANAAADAMIANGWQGFEPEWLNGRGSANPAQSMQQDPLVQAYLDRKAAKAAGQ